MSKETTYKHTRIPCPECRTGAYTVYDSHHAETYCKKCGHVIQDTRIFSIVDYLEQQNEKERVIYRLWHKKRKPQY